MSLDMKRWLGRVSWGVMATFFAWVAVCAAGAVEVMMVPVLPASGGVVTFVETAAAVSVHGLMNWGVPLAAGAAGILAVLARQRLVPVERVIIATSAVIAVTAVFATFGNSFCREVLGMASLTENVWWMFRV